MRVTDDNKKKINWDPDLRRYIEVLANQPFGNPRNNIFKETFGNSTLNAREVDQRRGLILFEENTCFFVAQLKKIMINALYTQKQ